MRAGFWVCRSSNRLSSQAQPRSCVSYSRSCNIVSQFSIHLPSPSTYFHKSCIVFKIWCLIIFDKHDQPNCSHHHLSISHETLTPTVDPRNLRTLSSERILLFGVQTEFYENFQLILIPELSKISDFRENFVLLLILRLADGTFAIVLYCYCLRPSQRL